MKKKDYTYDEIKALVDEIFVETFEIAPEMLSADKKIFEDLGLDSLDMVDMIVGLQKRFGISLRDNEALREIRTLGDIYDFFADYLKQNWTAWSAAKSAAAGKKAVRQQLFSKMVDRRLG